MTSTPFTSDAQGIDGHPDVAEISALTEDLLSRERADGASQAHRRLRSLRRRARIAGRRSEAASAPFRGRCGCRPTSPAALTLPSLPKPCSAPRPRTRPLFHVKPKPTSRGERRSKGDRETTKRRHAAAAVSRETPSARSGAPDRPAGHPSGPSRPGRHRPARRSRRWRSAVLAGAGAVVALSIGGLVVQSLGSPSAPSAASERDQGEQAQADGALEKRVQGLLAKQESAEKSKDSRTPDLKSQQSPENNPLAGTAASVPSCIREGIDRKESALAVDAKAPHKGGTGYLVVLSRTVTTRSASTHTWSTAPVSAVRAPARPRSSPLTPTHAVETPPPGHGRGASSGMSAP